MNKRLYSLRMYRQVLAGPRPRLWHKKGIVFLALVAIHPGTPLFPESRGWRPMYATMSLGGPRRRPNRQNRSTQGRRSTSWVQALRAWQWS